MVVITWFLVYYHTVPVNSLKYGFIGIKLGDRVHYIPVSSLIYAYMAFQISKIEIPL